MNSERSARRDWQKRVAIGLGRPLTKTEAAEVAKAWSEYDKRGGKVFPSEFIARWKGGSSCNS